MDDLMDEVDKLLEQIQTLRQERDRYRSCYEQEVLKVQCTLLPRIAELEEEVLRLQQTQEQC